jgi:hypothetical protein
LVGFYRRLHFPPGSRIWGLSRAIKVTLALFIESVWWMLVPRQHGADRRRSWASFFFLSPFARPPMAGCAHHSNTPEKRSGNIDLHYSSKYNTNTNKRYNLNNIAIATPPLLVLLCMSALCLACWFSQFFCMCMPSCHHLRPHAGGVESARGSAVPPSRSCRCPPLGCAPPSFL